MRKRELWSVTSIRIDPYPFFYVDYIAQDNTKILEWELANFSIDILHSKIVPATDFTIINEVLRVCRTKVYDEELKTFIARIVRDLVKMMSFQLSFHPQNRIRLSYIMDTPVETEIYNTNIKSHLRTIRHDISQSIQSRLDNGRDELLVMEEPIELD